MKVALYYPWIYLKSGCERTIVELVRRSRHDWTIMTNRYDADATFPELKSMNVLELPRISVRRSFLDVFRAGWRVLGQKLPLERQQLLVVFCEGLGDFVVFRNRNIPVLCVCFTPLRAAFDTAYQENYMEKHGNFAPRRILLRLAAGGFKTLDRIAWSRFQRVFAISDEVKARVLRGGLCPEDKLEILHPGIDVSRMQPSGRYKKEFLIAGRIMWTKNIELGISAFQDLLQRRSDLRDFQLAIAGFVDEKSKLYIAKLREMSASTPQIRFIESPSDNEMLELYRNCYALVYTPFNEDWGLVPIEAMASERPVIAVSRGGPRETIVHGKTGYLLPPNPRMFSNAMETLADNTELVRTMGKCGREHARRFSWDVFCDRVDEYISNLEAASTAGAQVEVVEQANTSSNRGKKLDVAAVD